MAALTRWRPGAIGRVKRSADRSATRRVEFWDGIKRTGVVSGTSFALGVWNGRVGGAGAHIPLIRVPADLGVGVLGYTLSVFGKQRHSETWRAIADGGLASYTSTLGVQMGNKWRTTGKFFGIGDEHEMLTGGGAMADDELARMVSA